MCIASSPPPPRTNDDEGITGRGRGRVGVLVAPAVVGLADHPPPQPVDHEGVELRERRRSVVRVVDEVRLVAQPGRRVPASAAPEADEVVGVRRAAGEHEDPAHVA